MGFDPTSAVPVDAASPTSSAFDPSSATPVDAPAPTETVGRVAGLGARALMQGAGQLADIPGHLIAGTDYVGKTIADTVRHLFGANSSQPAMQAGSPVANAATRAADAANLPTPATPGERIASSAVSALPSAVLAPEAPVAGALWSAAGGAASQATAEAGGGPVAQTLAGLSAGGLPVLGAGAAGLARTLTRGAGADAAAATADRLANAAANNVTLTAGQATGSRGLQAAERSSGNLWGGGPIGATAEKQTAAIGTRVDDIVGKLNAGGATLTPTGAGEAINTGVEATKQTMRQAEKSAYDKVDALVPTDHPVDVSATLSKLNDLATPNPNAAATTGALVSPKIVALRDNLAADAAQNGGSIPYSAARQVRTAIGNNIDWGFTSADPVANGAFKQAYGALGGDLDAAASSISPEAKQAVTDASSLYASNSAKRDLLNTIVNKAGGPEKVYEAATNGTKQGATKIGGVMSALDPQNANIVRATVLNKLGQAVPSAADSTGSFNAATFLTKWNQLAPEAKDALFGSSGAPGSLRSSLDSLTKTISTLRDAGHTLENPSGTGSSLGHTFTLWEVFKKLGETAGAVTFGAHELGSEHAIAAGVGSMTALGGAAGLNNVMARALTNPRTAAWLAQSTKLPASALPNAVNQLAKMGEATGDPDAQDLAAHLRAHGVGR